MIPNTQPGPEAGTRVAWAESSEAAGDLFEAQQPRDGFVAAGGV